MESANRDKYYKRPYHFLNFCKTLAIFWELNFNSSQDRIMLMLKVLLNPFSEKKSPHFQCKKSI